MTLPLPDPVQLGGDYIGARRASNALTASNLANAYNKVKTDWAPVTIPAQAMSQLAYSNLVGPQFVAKMLQNPEIAGSMHNPGAAANYAANAGLGQGNGNPFLNLKPNPQQNKSPFGMLTDFLGNYFKGGNQSSANNNALANQPQGMPANNMNAPQPQAQPQGSGVLMKDNGSVPALPPLTTPNQNIGFNNNNQPILNNNYGNPVIPNETPVQFAEKGATQRGIAKEGEKLGEYRATDIQDFGKQYESGLAINDKYKTFTELANDEQFRNMRKDIPFFQNKQLSALSKIGTSYQQELIGKFQTTANEIVGDIIRSFGAQKFKGEGEIAKNMKINDNDTFNTMIGKLESSMLYKNLNMERARLAPEIMEKYHVSKGKALEMADKSINGEEMRKEVEEKLDYPVQVRRKKSDGSYETKTVKKSEARKMGITNV